MLELQREVLRAVEELSRGQALGSAPMVADASHGGGELPQGVLVQDSLAIEERSPARSFTSFKTLNHQPTGSVYGASVGTANDMPACWPGCLEANAFVRLSLSRSSTLGLASRSPKSARHRASSSEALSSPGAKGAPVGLRTLARLTDPSSAPRIGWALAGLVLLMLDIVLVPYTLAWDVQFTESFKVLGLISASFWTCDILASCTRGYIKAGRLVTDFRTIVCAYAKSWACVDCLIVIVDWVYIAAETGHTDPTLNVGFLRLGRTVRLARLLRVFRLLRMARSVQELQDKLLISESFRFGLYLVTLLSGVLLVAHWLGCAWFAIGTAAATDTGMRWSSRGSFLEFEHESRVYQYMTVTHWALAQLSLGSMGLECSNSAERAFAAFCVLLGVMCSSTIISLLSACVLDLEARQQDKSRALEGVRKYLGENAVGVQLSYRVLGQIQDRLSVKRFLTFETVPALALLSTHLRVELQAKICEMHLTAIPIFHFLHLAEEDQFAQLCDSSISMQSFSKDDVVFKRCKPATGAYLLLEGLLAYSRPGGSESDDVNTVQVPQHGWLCEPALWCGWWTVGNASCDSPCKIMFIDRLNFINAVSEMPKVARSLHEYSRVCTASLREAGGPDGETTLDDLACSDFLEICWNMRKKVSEKISMTMLQALQEQGREPQVVVDKLAEEIRDGDCLLLPWEASYERVVAVVTFHLQDDRGRYLMEVAKVKGGRICDVGCRFPGGRQRVGETLADATERLLAAHLARIRDCMELGSATPTSHREKRKGAKLNTHYVKHVCQLTVSRELPWEPLPEAGVCSMRTLKTDAFTSEALHESVFMSHNTAGKGDGKLYMWVLPEDREFLNSLKGQPELLERLQGLTLPAVALEQEPSFEAEGSVHADGADDGDGDGGCGIPRTMSVVETASVESMSQYGLVWSTQDSAPVTDGVSLTHNQV